MTVNRKRQERPVGPAPGRTRDDVLDRALSARSVLASLLLGMHPPRLSGARLVAWAERFGIAPGTARVALSRMVDRGELAALGDGVYELAGRVRERQEAQDFALAPRLDEWQGAWLLAVVAPGSRGARDRADLRRAARAAKLVSPRDGVWTRPDNLPATATPASARDLVAEHCERWRGRPVDDAGRRALALFDLDAWAARARRLGSTLDQETAQLRAGSDDGLADAFRTGAAALTHVRADPLLPPELLPGGWPGAELRASYHAYREEFAAAVRAFFREGRADDPRSRR